MPRKKAATPAKQMHAPWDQPGQRVRCRDTVFGNNKDARPYGCPCRLTPEHDGPHVCSCGAQWTRDERRHPLVIIEPPTPAICGWGK